MKKSNILFFSLTMIILFFITSCYEIEPYMSTLVVNNLPEGEAWVSVFPNNFTKDELKRGSKFDALGQNHNSPFDLIWYVTITSGNRFVVIKFYSDPDTNSKNIRKVMLINFDNNGNATLNWEDMIDL